MNPILQAINKGNNNIMSTISAIKSGNGDALFNQMLSTNPQFAQFMNQNRGKSPEQIARENGIDINMVKNLLS